MARLIPASGSEEHVTPAGRAFTLEELQAFVGGYIEGIRTVDGKMMFLNEDGKRLGLPLNQAATALTRLAAIGDYIVGTVVVVEDFEVE
jgi:hypothetical protein